MSSNSNVRRAEKRQECREALANHICQYHARCSLSEPINFCSVNQIISSVSPFHPTACVFNRLRKMATRGPSPTPRYIFSEPHSARHDRALSRDHRRAGEIYRGRPATTPAADSKEQRSVLGLSGLSEGVGCSLYTRSAASLSLGPGGVRQPSGRQLGAAQGSLDGFLGYVTSPDLGGPPE
ncbi:hypothetical protein N7468_009904 [Penicillium chermesinum]|uniref:Uncharacterized protein n=1 Tax=Penicillium chermesinum TaxID=63820 RepID=A0A9W9NBN0_9EURO|nr:uncharacterized protein N7468_009904 [Penicillium chermesinum]KAJ5216896.1 hypothetical protein N7468_009904 [Penicillium chermesinum]